MQKLSFRDALQTGVLFSFLIRAFAVLVALGSFIASAWTQTAEVLTFDVACAVRAGEIAGSLYQAGKPLAVADVVIGATALVHGLGVASANVRHYQPLVPLGLSVENWRDE